MPHMLGLFCEKNMTIQTVSLGTAPSGAGGDTFRSTGAKMNENFTNNSHAASRLVGTATGNVMEVGAFGLGGGTMLFSDVNSQKTRKTGFYSIIGDSPLTNLNFPSSSDPAWWHCITLNSSYAAGEDGFIFELWSHFSSSNLFHRRMTNNGYQGFKKILDSGNTTIDSNGFVKAASPVIKLYSDKIESNDDAQQQNPAFEKVEVGHYLVKNTDGFAKEGWWVEVPTDSNGNRICAVEYQTLENGDLEIKTFKKKLNDEGDIVANLDAPIDIPSNANGEARWIDIRLHSVPKPTIHKVPRTEKQARMVQQVKYAPQLTYITKYEDLFDDAGNPVIVDGQKYQKPVTHIQTDKNGTPILSNQPVINESGEPVFEWVQAVDADGNLIFDDVPVLDADGNQIYDEVTYEPQQ